MYNYTISIIETNNKIERINYKAEEPAINVYNVLCMIASYHVNDIYGIQLWQHAKGKTIDNDARARIIKQYYIN